MSSLELRQLQEVGSYARDLVEALEQRRDVE